MSNDKLYSFDIIWRPSKGPFLMSGVKKIIPLALIGAFCRCGGQFVFLLKSVLCTAVLLVCWKEQIKYDKFFPCAVLGIT